MVFSRSHVDAAGITNSHPLPIGATLARRGAAAALAAAVLFAVSWATLERTAGHHQLRDTPLYEAYGDATVAGDLAYRDFALEYPPGALPAFVVPEWGAGIREHFIAFNRSFEFWMALCGMAMAACISVGLVAQRASGKRIAAALLLVAASPMLLGSVILTRFDLWPSALTAGALAALLTRRLRLSAIVLAAAVAAKLYAVVCVPLVLIWIYKHHGRRAALLWSALAAATLAAVFAPFAVLSPRGLAHVFTFQVGRPLQIESLGGALLVGALHLGAIGHLHIHDDHGSTNFVGHLPSLVANVSTVCGATLLVLIVVLFAKGAASTQRLVIGVSAAVVTFIAFGKVFSPQYMIWPIPLVALIGGRRGLWAGLLLGGSLVLTQTWFPQGFGAYAFRLDPLVSIAVLARDITMVALAVLLTSWLRAQREPSA